MNQGVRTWEPTDIYLVGGTENVLTDMQRKLGPEGGNVVAHWGITGQGARRMPYPTPQCDLVLLLTDCCTHAMAQAARIEAHKARVPVIVGEWHRFVLTRQRLRDEGYIKAGYESVISQAEVPPDKPLTATVAEREAAKAQPEPPPPPAPERAPPPKVEAPPIEERPDMARDNGKHGPPPGFREGVEPRRQYALELMKQWHAEKKTFSNFDVNRKVREKFVVGIDTNFFRDARKKLGIPPLSTSDALKHSYDIGRRQAKPPVQPAMKKAAKAEDAADADMEWIAGRIKDLCVKYNISAFTCTYSAEQGVDLEYDRMAPTRKEIKVK